MIQFRSNFHTLEVVDRGSETQLQVGEKLNRACHTYAIIKITQNLSIIPYNSHVRMYLMIQFSSNFHILEVVDRDSETQLQVGEKLNRACHSYAIINTLFLIV